MKGNSSCHIPNDKYRKKFEGIRKECGCRFGEKCECGEPPPFDVFEIRKYIIDNNLNDTFEL